MALITNAIKGTLDTLPSSSYKIQYIEAAMREIAENYGISRQGVRDVIVRAESIMTEVEDRTGLMRRFMRGRDAVNAIEESARKIEAINRHQYDNDQISEQTSAILASLKTLKE